MSDKEMLLDYMTRFRLECHYRLDMVPGDISELPIFMYKGAQEHVKEEMTRELNLSQDKIDLIDQVGEFFINKLEELDHYTETDDLVMNSINNDKFTK